MGALPPGRQRAFITGDLFNLCVFYEVLLMSSFVLLTLAARRARSTAASATWFWNLMGSMMLLLAAGITYGTPGTLNMAILPCAWALRHTWWQAVIAGLLLIVLGAKAAAFPVFWLPSSHHTHPAVTAPFSGVLTKVAVLALPHLPAFSSRGCSDEWQP